MIGASDAARRRAATPADARAASRRSTASRRARSRWTPADVAADARRRRSTHAARSTAAPSAPPRSSSGSAGALLDTHRRVREAAPAVRRADRLASRRSSTSSPTSGSRSSSPARSSTGPRTRSRTATRDASVHVSMAKARAGDAARARGPPRAPVPRRHRLLVRARPAPLDEAGLGARRAPGATPPGTGRASAARSCSCTD